MSDLTLRCVRCGTEKTVDATATVRGKSIIVWWAQNGKVCNDCRAERVVSLEEFRRLFDASVFGERPVQG